MKQKIILGVVVLAVVVAFATGIFNWDKTYGWVRNIFYRGKHEVQTFGASKPIGNLDHANGCRLTLQAIESAKRAVADRHGQAVGAVPLAEVLDFLPSKKMPVCPDGGQYSIGDLEHVARCSIANNGTVDIKDDHSLQSF